METQDFSNVFKNIIIPEMMILEKFIKGEITIEKAADIIRMNNEIQADQSNND